MSRLAYRLSAIAMGYHMAADTYWTGVVGGSLLLWGIWVLSDE